MPKTSNYSNCVFYRLVCRDPTVTECYVGHTCNEVKRRSGHKTKCTNEKSKAYTYFVYRFIRDHGGFENWQLIVHEKLAVKDKVDARLRERFWCEFYKATLNKQVPGRTRKEKNKKYHADHREELNKYSTAYNLTHEAHLKEIHTCECGGKFTTTHRSTHLKSKKHIKYVATQ